MSGLSVDTLREIKECFVKYPQIDKVLLYGSRAKGNYKSGSDIDISLIGKGLSLANTIYPLQEQLDELYLPYQFDISIFEQLDNPDLIAHILRAGKTFYQKPNVPPKHWEVRTLEDCIDKVKLTQKIPKKQFLKNGLYPIVSQEYDYTNGYWNNHSDAFKIEKPVIIFGDHTKIVKYVDFDFILGADGVKILLPKSNIYSKFFFYKIKSFNLPDLGYARHYRLLKKVEIPIPPLPEQKQIVKKLDACFNEISQAKTNLEQNLQNAKDLFQSALTQVFTEQGDDWTVKTLGEVCKVLDSLRKPITKRYRVEGEYPYYGATGILSYVHQYIFNEKLVLIGEDGAKWLSGDNTSFIVEGKCWVNNHAHVIKPNREVVLDEWIVYFLNFSDLSKYITGLTVPKLNQSKMRGITIPIPPLPKQKQIAKKLDKLNQQTQTLANHYQNQLKSLEILKQSLLEKAFLGELV